MKKSFISKYKYELTFFTVFMFEFLLKIPRIDEMVGWRTTQYVVNYKEYGLVEMGLIGSIFRMFTDYITPTMVYIFELIGVLLLSVTIAVFLGKMIRNSSEEIKFAVMMIVLLYVISPLSLTKFFSSRNYGIFDVFLMLIAFWIALLAIRRKNLWLLFPLSMIALMIHHVFALTYYMFVFGALMYYVFENKFEKKTTLFSVITVGISVIVTLYFQFFREVSTYTSTEEAVAAAKENSGLLIEYEVLSRLFDPVDEYINKWSITGLYGKTMDIFDRSLALLFTLALLSPMVVLFVAVWVKCVRRSVEKNEKIFYLFCLLSPLFSVVLFISAIDWDRWMMGILTAQMSFIFFLIHKKNETFYSVIRDVSSFLQSHKALCIAYLVFVGLLRCSPIEFSLGDFGKELLGYSIKY